MAASQPHLGYQARGFDPIHPGAGEMGPLPGPAILEASGFVPTVTTPLYPTNQTIGVGAGATAAAATAGIIGASCGGGPQGSSPARHSRRRRGSPHDSSPSSSSDSSGRGGGGGGAPGGGGPGFPGSPRPHRRRSDKTRRRRSRSTSIPLVLPALPDVASFNSWRTSVKGIVMNCHRDPTRAIQWVCEVEADGMTVNRLGEGSSRWRKLDRKLLQAVHKVAEAQRHSSLYKCVLNEQEAQLRQGRVFTGRRALFTIYRFYEVNKDTATIMNIEGLVNLRYPGDHQMEQFYNTWNEIMNYQRPNLNDLELATTLWRKLQGSQKLKTVVDLWDSLPKSDPQKTYAYLWDHLHRYVERSRADKVQEARAALNAMQRGSPAAPVNDAVCRFWKQGDCQRGAECQFQHPPEMHGVAPRRRDAGPSSPGGKKGGRSASVPRGKHYGPISEDGLQPGSDRPICFEWARTGNCTREACRWAHRPPTAEEALMLRQKGSGGKGDAKGGKAPATTVGKGSASRRRIAWPRDAMSGLARPFVVHNGSRLPVSAQQSCFTCPQYCADAAIGCTPTSYQFAAEKPQSK